MVAMAPQPLAFFKIFGRILGSRTLALKLLFVTMNKQRQYGRLYLQQRTSMTSRMIT